MDGTAAAYGLTFRFPALDTAVGACLRDHGEFAKPEMDFISQCCAGDLIDVGANIGAICLPFARDNPESRVLAIEAHPGLAALLRRNVTANRLPNVTVLGDVAGEASGGLQIPVVPLDTASDAGTSLYAKGPPMAAARMVRTDDVAPPNVDFVKIDVEGFEPRVLDGAARLLNEVRPNWLVTVSRQRPNATAKVRAILTAAGYRLYWFFSPFVTRPADGHVRGAFAIFATDRDPLALPPSADDLPAVSDEWPADVGHFPYLRAYRLFSESQSAR